MIRCVSMAKKRTMADAAIPAETLDAAFPVLDLPIAPSVPADGGAFRNDDSIR